MNGNNPQIICYLSTVGNRELDATLTWHPSNVYQLLTDTNQVITK